jgi:hypothetical protein
VALQPAGNNTKGNSENDMACQCGYDAALQHRYHGGYAPGYLWVRWTTAGLRGPRVCGRCHLQAHRRVCRQRA